MARPRLETRIAVLAAFQRRCAAPAAGLSWPDVVEDAGVDPRCPSEVRLVQKTVQNMVKAGEIVRVGERKAGRVYLALYAPARAVEQHDPIAALQRAWSRP